MASLENEHPASIAILPKCNGCRQIFSTMKFFEMHAVICNWDLVFTNASKEPSNIVSFPLMEVLLIVSLNLLMMCEFCDACFLDEESLLYHEAHHAPSSGYACTCCNLNCVNLQTVLAHREVCSDYAHFRATYPLDIRMMYICNVCKSQFGSLPELYVHRHSNRHYFPRRIVVPGREEETSNGLWIGCELCGFTCQYIDKFLSHRNLLHSANSSEVAENSSLTQRSKVAHIEKDSSHQTRRYLCDHCGKMYACERNLNNHLRAENGIKPFVCTVPGCSRRFTLQVYLNVHKRRHTGERPFECEICHKRFITSSARSQHRRIHRNDRPFACEDCDSRFNRMGTLKQHRVVHTDEKPFVCTHCDEKFNQIGTRNKHVRRKHTN